MNKRMIALALATATLAGAAMAEDKPVGLGIRFGLFSPSDAAARNGGNSWVAFGADFKLRDLKFRGQHSASEVGLSMDYTAKNGFRNLPILLNYTTALGGDAYYKIGAGLAFTNDGGSDSTRFAYGLGLGYNLNKGENATFIEIKYLGNERTIVNGFGVYLGAKL